MNAKSLSLITLRDLLSHGVISTSSLFVRSVIETKHTESRSLDSDVVASYFEKTAWDQYVLSPRLPPLVHKFKDLPDE